MASELSDFEKGCEFQRNRSYLFAYNHFLKAYESKDLRGCYYLGQTHLGSFGTYELANISHLKDWDKAIKYFEISVNSGCAEAARQLAWIYSCDSFDNKEKQAKAFQWSVKAADLGCPISQYNVGYAYLYGKTTENDVKKAFKYISLAAKADYSKVYAIQLQHVTAIPQEKYKSQKELGYMFENGIGTTIDLNEALKWYKLASETNDVMNPGKECYERLKQQLIAGQSAT